MESARLTKDLRPWRPRLAAAMRYDIDGHGELEIVERVKSGEFLAVEIDAKCLVVLEVLEGDNRTLNVVVCLGWSMCHWLGDLVDFLKTLARDQGCKSVRIQGRMGWLKVLTAHGFKKRAVLMELNAHG